MYHKDRSTWKVRRNWQYRFQYFQYSNNYSIQYEIFAIFSWKFSRIFFNNSPRLFEYRSFLIFSHLLWKFGWNVTLPNSCFPLFFMRTTHFGHMSHLTRSHSIIQILLLPLASLQITSKSFAFYNRFSWRGEF